MKQISQFNTEDPAKLGMQLSALEKNAHDALDAAQSSCAPQPAAPSFTATAAKGIVSLGPDQQLTVDTSQASAAVVLPALTPANFGRPFRLIKPLSANSVLVSCQDATVTCNGTTFPTIAAVGVTVFYCDRFGYYK